MEGLMQRLERAVTRLEKLSATMQSSSVANGGCVNGVDGGKSPFRNEKRNRENGMSLQVCPCVCKDLSQAMEAFDLILNGPVSEYLKISQAIGDEVEKHVSCVRFVVLTAQLSKSGCRMSEGGVEMLIESQVVIFYKLPHTE